MLVLLPVLSDGICGLPGIDYFAHSFRCSGICARSIELSSRVNVMTKNKNGDFHLKLVQLNAKTQLNASY